MKQTLSLKLGQQLTMTPQLQQAIRLLQLSTVDLQQEIQQTLESNPMLELEEEEPTEDGNEIEEPAAVIDDSTVDGEGIDAVEDGDDDSEGASDPTDDELDTPPRLAVTVAVPVCRAKLWKTAPA